MILKRIFSLKTVVLSLTTFTLISGCTNSRLSGFSNGYNKVLTESNEQNINQNYTANDYTIKSGGSMSSHQLGLSMPYADLSFTILPEQKRIEGLSKVTLHTSRPISTFSVDLDSNFSIEEVAVNGAVLPSNKYTNQSGELIINVDAEVNGNFEVMITYSGHPREAIRAPWDGGFEWKKTKSGEHWIATAVQGEGCDLFWPCIDQPHGEVESMDIRITVPDDLVAASNGVLQKVTANDTQKTYHWKTSSLHNTYGVALNIGPYGVLEDTYDSVFGNKIPVVFYHLQENEAKSKILFEEFAPMLDFFETVIGPYPFGAEKMGVAETHHLGMEHQTINAYGNQYRIDEFGYDWLLHHEFAHEWFGNQLTNNNWDHMWLHEGFGSYMQPLYTQYLHGDMAYKAHLFKQRKGLMNKFPIVSNQQKAVEEVYNKDVGPGGDIYAKGSLILHSLRELIGDQAFFDATRLLVYGTKNPKPGNFKPRFSDSNEFIAIVNQLTGKNLQWFFDVYLYQASLPKLNIQRNEDSMSFSWEIENNKPFPMPLEVTINGKLRTLELIKPQTIEVRRTDVVIIDPNSKVLRHSDSILRYQQDREQKIADALAAQKKTTK